MLGHDLSDRRQARAVRRGSACSATPPGSTTSSRSPTTCASGAGQPGRTRATSRRRSAPAASTVDWPISPSPACRPGSAAAPRWPAWWPVARSCGCSTSPTPGSTRTVATSSTGSCGRRSHPAPRCCSSSHELDRAAALAHRVGDHGRRHHPRHRGPRSPDRPRRPSLFRDAALVAGKDLRVELRSQVTTQQVAPFAILVLILFGVALDPDRGILTRASAGLFWVAVLFCSPARHPAGLHHRGRRRRPRRPAAVGPRPGRASSSARPAPSSCSWSPSRWCSRSAWSSCTAPRSTGVPLLLATCVAATAGLSAAGTLYGVLAAGLRVRETLLPILLLPVLAPVLIGATKALRGRARGRGRRRLAVVRPARHLRPALHRLRHPRLRHPPGGVVTMRPPTPSPRRSREVHP